MTLIEDYGLDSPARTLILLVLSAKDLNQQREMDVLHIQKTIKFFEHLRKKTEIEFSNYKYGGVSYELEENLERLQEYGLIELRDHDFMLTPEGGSAAELLRQRFSKNDYEQLIAAKKRLNDLPVDELLFFMYMMFPETQKHSIEFPRLDRKKELLVKNLFLKRKIDATTASKWLGIEEKEFLKSELKDKLSPAIIELLMEGYQESAKEDLIIAKDFEQVENELDEECDT